MFYQREAIFRSFDEFNSYTHGWDLEFSTTAPDQYTASLHQTKAPGLLVNSARFSSPSLQRGTTPENTRTFALASEMPNPCNWRGLPVTDKTLMFFPEDRELMSTMGANAEILTVSVDQRVVDTALERWELDPNAMFSQARTENLSTAHFRKLKRHLSLVTEFMIRYGEHDNFSDWSRGVQEYLFETLLTTAISQTGHPVASLSSAAKRMRKATDYILIHLSEPISVAEICDYVGCSRRSLEESFRKNAGTTPKHFIHALRLEKCRQALRNAAPGDRVNRIAVKYGFWHMGQFSADYKRLYGELPSQTLSNQSL